MASYYNWPTWGTHIEESLPLSAGRYITTPNMPAWDEDSKSSLSQLYMLGMHQCLLAIYNICLKNSGMPVNYSHGLKFKVKSHCGDNKASLAAHREEIRRPLLCHVSLWLAIANKLYIVDSQNFQWLDVNISHIIHIIWNPCIWSDTYISISKIKPFTFKGQIMLQ